MPDPAPREEIGIDIVEVERIRRAIERHGERFLTRVFTPHEVAVCRSRARPAESFAARFAAKEAFAKAWRGPVTPAWRDVEVVMEGVRPAYRLRGAAAGARARLSLSHTHQFAVAVAWVAS